MDALLLLVAGVLPWWLGVALLLAVYPKRRALEAPGEIAWLLGAGYFAGAFLLTVEMRALSLAGVRFGVLAVVGPVALAAIACSVIAWRRQGPGLVPASRGAARALIAPADLEGAARVLWWALLAWLAVRFALLGVELASRPLYPWDAWTQWATKARVWYELGRIAPFARVDAWLAGNGAVYFDASPEYPPTMPLLQVFSCLLLGRWDDTLMNVPWLQIAVALALAVYGGLRSLDASQLAALVGSFLVASLPLANVHVALAGYADLPQAAWYAAAAIALLRWTRSRTAADGATALLLAIACTQIKNPGWFWALTLVPGVVVALWPRYALRIALVGFALVAVALASLARFPFSLFGYQVNPQFNPAWGDVLQSYFLLGNWHLLWYGAVAAALLAGRQLVSPPLMPLTVVVGSGLVFLFVVFAYTTASFYITDQTTVNRATLHLAPLVVVFLVLAWQAFARRWAAAHPVAA